MTASHVRVRDCMNVLMVSTSYPRDSGDWRGIFIFHISSAIARIEEIKLKLWAPPGDLGDGVTAVTTASEASWLAQLLRRGGISHEMRQEPLRGSARALRLLQLIGRACRRQTDTDVYHINWLQCMLPLPRDGKPALVTVLGNDMKLLRLPFVKRALRRAMRGRIVAVCPNASWMESSLRTAFGDIAEIASVPFGIDPRWYAIQRTIHAASPCRWLAVTRLTADKLGPLFEWSRPLFESTARELHLFGPMQEQIEIPYWVRYHGPATPEQLSTQWFPHSHGLISLSRHAEGRPQVMLEAMAGGLPIIASRMPAHADIVKPAETGALCESASEYSKAVVAIEDFATNRQMGANARAKVRDELGTWDDCAQRYMQIYRRLLEQSSHG